MRNDKKAVSQEIAHLLSEESPFAIQEAYKLLRTNLIFTMPGEGCKKIVVTSSDRSEGKSTTAINLAIAIAQNQSRVLLLDCDLRLPTVSKKLKIKNVPGLTEALVGIRGQEMQIYALPSGVHVLTAGTIPPNPTELLGSEQMQMLLDRLSEKYEYIIIDTPPINEVADAVILSKYASGVLVVVRQNMSTTRDVDAALQKLEFAEAKVLGFVLSGAEEDKRAYKKKYGKKYGYKYGYGYYGYGYGRKRSKKPESSDENR
ncbi:MAG: CpsD/CapB family tyrosine-protein kinase [Clostridia bacterium]|nr:CpsD/CapB family tyrosine-protein kinase [Clostridia bacterium]